MEHNYANKSLTYLFLFFFFLFGRNLILSLAEPPSSCLSSMASGLILITLTVVLPVWHILLILETTGKENHQSYSYSFGISTLNSQNPCELCLYIHRCARPHIMEKWKVFFTHIHPCAPSDLRGVVSETKLSEDGKKTYWCIKGHQHIFCLQTTLRFLRGHNGV